MLKALLLLLPLSLSSVALAQTAGEISGMITDSSGAVISGAAITVTNPQTNFRRTSVSGNSGNYSFPSLPPGLYNVRAETQGFKSEVRNSVQLEVQQTARIDFQLTVGAVTETVEVSGGAPLLNTENATVGTVIEQRRIVDLPLNGRSFISLIALSPNVTSGNTVTGGYAQVRGGGTRGLVSLSVAGMRREFTYYTLDGITNTDIDFNTYAFLPSVDALQEFKVQTGVYSAEFGRQAAQVNISTRSGTNEYHGTMFEFLRNNALDARPFAFTNRVPESAPFKWNQYGFTLGGPVQIPRVINGKDRLFFMSNFEGFKLRNQAQQVFSVPSAEMRTGNFAQILPTLVRDFQNNNQPFSGNIIPPSRFSKVAVGLLEFYPLPNIPGTGLVNNHLALLNNTSDKNQFSQRLDFVESEKSNWFGRYSWQNDGQVNSGLYKNGTLNSNSATQIVISNTRILTPTLVNDFRAGYLGYHSALLNEQAYKRSVTKELNIPLYLDPPPIAWGTPTVSIQGFSGFGDIIQGPFTVDDHTFQWNDNVSWTHGSHTTKFGADIRRDRYNSFGNQNTRGTFAVQNQATGYGFGDYMLGYISSTSTTAGLAVSQLRATSQYYYLTNNWKARPNLTIEAGLRYEYNPAWNSKGDSMLNMVFPNFILAPNAPAGTSPYLIRDCAAYGQTSFYPPGIMTRFDPKVSTRCDSSYGSSLVVSDRNDFAPRLGIAWSPSSKWTIRTGLGIFFVQDENNAYLDTARNFAGKVRDPANLITHSLTFEKPLNVAAGSAVCGVPSPPYACLVDPSPNANDPHRRTPYVVQYEMNVQRQLTQSTVLEVGYLGTQGHKLQRLLFLNTAVPGATGSVDERSPWPEWSTIQLNKGISGSNYHGGSLKLTRRLSSGFSYLMGYTFSKSMDNASGLTPANGLSLRVPQTGWCVRCEYGRSDFDTRRRFVASAMYELPFGKGKPMLNRGFGGAIFGGWQINSIFTHSTGFPIDVLAGLNQSNTGIGQDRPNAVANAGGSFTPSTGQWFNIQKYIVQPFGQFGNLGRNTETGPGIVSWDFSTLKTFPIKERASIQFRFECFNCANHPNFGDPGISLAANQRTAAGIPIPGTGTFGQITTTRPGVDMRQLQFSLKILF